MLVRFTGGNEGDSEIAAQPTMDMCMFGRRPLRWRPRVISEGDLV
jgi:hypothetical protein